MDWDRAEKRWPMPSTPGLPWQESAGEGAFYGPKIEFFLKDCIGVSGNGHYPG